MLIITNVDHQLSPLTNRQLLMVSIVGSGSQALLAFQDGKSLDPQNPDWDKEVVAAGSVMV